MGIKLQKMNKIIILLGLIAICQGLPTGNKNSIKTELVNGDSRDQKAIITISTITSAIVAALIKEGVEATVEAIGKRDLIEDNKAIITASSIASIVVGVLVSQGVGAAVDAIKEQVGKRDLSEDQKAIITISTITSAIVAALIKEGVEATVEAIGY